LSTQAFLTGGGQCCFSSFGDVHLYGDVRPSSNPRALAPSRYGALMRFDTWPATLKART